MKGKNFVVISALILVFDIALGFILGAYRLDISQQDIKILYIVSKCVVIMAFIWIIVLFYIKKDVANYVIHYIATLILQFVPLAVRYLSLTENGFLASVIISSALIIIYCALTAVLLVLGNKTAKAANDLKGQILPTDDGRAACKLSP